MYKCNWTTATCIFLLFLIVNSDDDNSDDDNSDKEGAHCETRTLRRCRNLNLVAGHSQIGAGYDITTMKITLLRLVDVDTWIGPNGTCTVCQNRYFKGTPYQKYPVNVLNWFPKSECVWAVESQVHTSLTTISESEEQVLNSEWKTDLKITIPQKATTIHTTLAGSHSKAMQFSIQRSLSKKSIFARREVKCIFYSITLEEKAKMTDRFKKEIATLPVYFNESTEKQYWSMISKIGTHVVKHAELGGKLKVITTMQSCELALNQISIDEAADCLAMDLAAHVGAKKAKAIGKIGTRAISGEGGVKINSCANSEQMSSFMHKFSSLLQYTEEETVGGDAVNGLYASGNLKHVKEWMESVKIHPGLIKFQIKPIYEILDDNDPRRASMENAVREYIWRRRLILSCRTKCSMATAENGCSCECPFEEATNSNCCPKKRGMGRLFVNVRYAKQLWGDTLSGTDAYVTVRYLDKTERTPTVNNHNNPYYDIEFDFGVVEVTDSNDALKIDVYDVDPNRVEHLGGCGFRAEVGLYHQKICYLNSGHVYFQYSLACAYSFFGNLCEKYEDPEHGFQHELKNI